jgi:hypothetical protein
MLTVNADILFASVALNPRFNVEPSAPPIFVNGDVAPIASIRVTGTLRYTGSGHSSDRPYQIPSDSVGATIESSGAGPLTLTGGITGESSTGSKTFTLGGSNEGEWLSASTSLA